MADKAISKKNIENFPVIGSVPFFEKNIYLDSIDALIPVGYAHIVSGEYDISTDTFDLYFSQAEEGNELIKIPARIFMPSERKSIFPDFVLQVSTFFGQKFDYSVSPEYIINQNQMLYLIILHRLMQYDGQNTHYTHLLRSDISALANYGEYNSYSSYNAKRKSENYITIISPWTFYSEDDEFGNTTTTALIESPIGEFISNDYLITKIDDKLLNAIFRDLPIQPASESMASESVKFVSYPHNLELYRCAGYTTNNDVHHGVEYPVMRTIYPRKPNLPSRIKTHIISDCYNFKDSDSPIFYEDIYSIGSGEVDNTIKNAFVVFDEMDGNTGRLLCGEIEASKSFSDSVIYKDEVVRECFKSLDIKVGEHVARTGNKFVLGKDDEDDDIALYNFDSVEIKSIEDTGYGSSYKIIARCSKKIGSSKALSTTGLKGMTKPKPDLGRVAVLDIDGAEVCDEDGNPFVFNADLIVGMNSVKAKSNSIFLARAALSSFMCISENDLLYSMNADEINMEANKIGKCLWIDQFGNEKLVWFGVAQIRVNELSYMFNNVKPQKFMAESGRYLRDGGYEKIFKKVWELGVDPDMKNAVLELQKILKDDKAYYASHEVLPILTPDDLLYGVGPDSIKMFEVEDCQFDLNPTRRYTGKMFDEEWNEGWYLDLTPLNPKLGYTRMPSAKLLNLLTRELPDGRWSYPVIYRIVSKIVSICLTINTEGDYKGKRNLAFLVDIKKGDREHNSGQKHIARYLSIIHGMIYKKKDLTIAHSKMIDVFMKPQIPGVGMKQMADAMVPQGTGVIIDARTYKLMASKTGGFCKDKGHFNALCIRNPVLWKSQIQSIKVINRESFAFNLLLEQGLDLDEYLSSTYCREILLMNPEDILVQQADCDGDLMPVFVIDDYECQVEIEEIREKNVNNSSCGGLNDILKQEVEWLNDYRMDELSANEDLDLDGKVYEVYSIPIGENPVDSKPTFLKYFKDSIIAKGEVGGATIQLWAVNTLLEIYKDMCDNGEIVDHRGRPDCISESSCRQIVFAYTMLIQLFVVRGIKHVEGGSSGFEPFKLNKISVNMPKSARLCLKNTVNMSNDAIAEFENMLHWMKDKKYLQSVTKYIAMFNSGKVIENVNPAHIKRIEKCSFYGHLLEDLKAIENEVLHGFKDISNEEIINPEVVSSRTGHETQGHVLGGLSTLVRR